MVWLEQPLVRFILQNFQWLLSPAEYMLLWFVLLWLFCLFGDFFACLFNCTWHRNSPNGKLHISPGFTSSPSPFKLFQTAETLKEPFIRLNQCLQFLPIMRASLLFKYVMRNDNCAFFTAAGISDYWYTVFTDVSLLFIFANSSELLQCLRKPENYLANKSTTSNLSW